MSDSSIPEYYRHLADKPKPKDLPPPLSAPQARSAPAPAAPVPAPVEAPTYLANRFTLALPEDWTDSTIFILAGPVAEEMQHNITVMVEPDVDMDSLADFADRQVQALEDQLKGCHLLLKEPVSLNSGVPAYRAIFCWYPVEDKAIYQEQLYVLHDKTGYKLTASFTRKTRKTLGPQVERIMLSFMPGSPMPPQAPADSRRGY